MATNKHRINVSLSKPVDRAIARLADRDDVPPATKAAELLALALEIEEDEVWNAVAVSRDKKGAKFVSHKAAWG